MPDGLSSLRSKALQSFQVFVLLISLSGCATFIKQSPDFDAAISRTKTIAVMPADIEVYQLSAGGVRELMEKKYGKEGKERRGLLSPSFSLDAGNVRH